MPEYKYKDAYKSIRTPRSLADKVLNAKPTKKAFNYKSLISVAACVIIVLLVFPSYIGLTDPSVRVVSDMPMVARYVGIQIPVELKLNRRSVITVSKGTLEGYDGGYVKGDITLIWNIDTDVYDTCTLTVKDSIKTTVYTLSNNENNGSWSIIKN